MLQSTRLTFFEFEFLNLTLKQNLHIRQEGEAILVLGFVSTHDLRIDGTMYAKIHHYFRSGA